MAIHTIFANIVISDEHLIPTLCFMCVGCEECAEQCSKGIFEWLDQESKE